jgi:uncharacterized protein YxjI
MLRRRGMRGAALTPTIQPAEMPSGEVGNRYRMVERLVAFGDDFFIENEQGQRVFKVDGKAIRLRNTLMFQDTQGHEICKIQQRIARMRDTMEVEDPQGNRLAIVHRAMITPLRDRFVVKIADGPELRIQGNILAHEYRIGNVATVSKKWFRVRDSYGVEIAPGQNDLVVLATTVCIDQLAHDTR